MNDKQAAEKKWDVTLFNASQINHIDTKGYPWIVEAISNDGIQIYGYGDSVNEAIANAWIQVCQEAET